MCSSTTAERQSLASRDRTCCLRRCLPARPLRYYGFRVSITHPTQSLCTLRTRRRRRPRNTRYRAPATAYPDRSLTGRTTPAYLAHKQSMPQERMDCFVAALPCANASRLSQAMTEERRSPDGAQRNSGLKLSLLRPPVFGRAFLLYTTARGCLCFSRGSHGVTWRGLRPFSGSAKYATALVRVRFRLPFHD